LEGGFFSLFENYRSPLLRGRMTLESARQAQQHPPMRAWGSNDITAHLPNNAPQPLVEMAYICNPKDAAQTERARAFFDGAFGADSPPPPWHLFPAISGPPGGCPTASFTDKAGPAKGIGIKISHKLVWSDFVRRHHHGYLVVFENDAVCAVDNCGAAIKKALAQAKSAFVFLGWCNMAADADPRTTRTPPWCSHGYALTAHAARYARQAGRRSGYQH
jgi:hypothetical protein